MQPPSNAFDISTLLQGTSQVQGRLEHIWGNTVFSLPQY